MTARRFWVAAPVALLALFGAAACGGGSDAEDESRGDGYGEIVVQTVIVERSAFEKVVVEKQVAPAAMATPAPAMAAAQGFSGGDSRVALIEVASSGATAFERQVAAAASQQRIIVRTVDLELQVEDVTRAIEAVSTIADEFGGWVVSSQRSATHRGSVSVRVPAERLDEGLADIRRLAVKVESENATSQDFTDEYSDTTARVRTLEATEAALLKLFERASEVEDAIAVQTELTKVQSDLESLRGRLQLLEQTSAFSLVNIGLRAVPTEITVDAGLDLNLAVGSPVRFRASFTPPEDIEDFEITWDFGDGSQPTTVYRTAPTLEEGTLFTAPVSHVYGSDDDSPFIVTVELKGTGEGGIAEGSDTLIATVSRLPAIEVFAGERVTVEEGERVELVGSFTRPEGLDNLRFEWDFGDGTAAFTGDLAPRVTTATASHVYPNHRPFPFTATLKVSGESEAGEAEGVSTVQISVVDAPGWVVGGTDPGESGRGAVRALSSVGSYALQVLIWAGILSPLWVPLSAVAFWVYRRRRAATA